MLILEEYNGHPTNQYQQDSDGIGGLDLPLTKMESTRKGSSTFSSLTLPSLLIHLEAFFTTVFLPQGYPATVTPDYLRYQVWDTAQAFASSLTGALATAAVLKGVGVGSETASVLAASITWLLKDGTGMVGRIVFAWAKGTRLDSECKKWRLVADGLNDIAFFVDLLAPHFSIAFFAPCACISSLLRSIVGVAGGATRTSIVRHQARRDNLADVAAKDGSQETLVNVLSLVVSLVLLPLVDEKPLVIWSLFVLFTIAHLYSNYKAVKALQLDTLNQSRFAICIRQYISSGTVPSVADCNYREPLFFAGNRRLFGCELGNIPWKSSSCHRYQQEQGKWVCAYDQQQANGWIALGAEASNQDHFSAVFQLEYFAVRNSWPLIDKNMGCSKEESQFRNLMLLEGWELHTHQLNVDEWRYRLEKSVDKLKDI